MPRRRCVKRVAAIVLVLIAGSCGGSGSRVATSPGDGGVGSSTSEARNSDQRELQPESLRWEPAKLGLGSWTGARTSADGRSLLVTLVGGPHYREVDGCSVAYSADVEETLSSVRLTLLSARPPVVGEVTCSSVGHFRTVEVPLDAPLGGRRLIEVQFDREQPVFDGSRLLEPGWLPEGFTLRTEGPGYPNPEQVRSWQRVWAGPQRPPRDGRCTPGDAAIALTQGDAVLVDEYPSNGEQPRRTHDVGGATATFYDGGRMGVTRLTWIRGGEGFVLSSTPGCAGDTAASEEVLLRIARGLKPAHPKAVADSPEGAS